MVRITIELLRKRSEHNEGEISTLEELSLHQEDIEKIENLQNWCRELRILLLQSNLIPKIENLNKMKKLEYLNLALNNIERIENLDRCESLEKLDLTLNFIGELTSVESLKANIHLHTLYLTGNPCTEFSGYRDYVIATLPQLQILDADTILKSDRIKALQRYEMVAQIIMQQQENYKSKRDKQRQDHQQKGLKNESSKKMDDPEELKKFWDELCDNSPETRVELATVSRKQKEQEKKRETGCEDNNPKRTIRLFRDDGQPLSINEPRIPFTLTEDNEHNSLVLNIEIYRHLDTLLIEADVQPKYVRVYIKGKVFQIVLPEDVHPDKSTAKRSQSTGHLVIEMQMVREANARSPSQNQASKSTNYSSIPPPVNNSRREYLEIGKADTSMDFSQITSTLPKTIDRSCLLDFKHQTKAVSEKPVSASFQDNQEVPPLE
ncbi:dynein axonemal assembly factor 11 isoform X1 [Frankliniella occidentalis]|uniref:Dynein axonemal assembly factor 11 isoform X1 n=1 Tax=Frankliniella occidentalis TaxID=133901 RepID=A0A9C6XTX6_FRAOC|nr:dynein axonemal assembly factor 11 isoform X1 [Frankliniella occidentalis]XP_052130906.1 dynein axonemal assembly factor 11 isoform X1 [Frankliniella occidentalis]